jgi:hypothetical protein
MLAFHGTEELQKSHHPNRCTPRLVPRIADAAPSTQSCAWFSPSIPVQKTHRRSRRLFHSANFFFGEPIEQSALETLDHFSRRSYALRMARSELQISDYANPDNRFCDHRDFQTEHFIWDLRRDRRRPITRFVLFTHRLLESLEVK